MENSDPTFAAFTQSRQAKSYESTCESIITIAALLEHTQSNLWPSHIDADIASSILIKLLKIESEYLITK
jgi:hypothetical protein